MPAGQGERGSDANDVSNVWKGIGHVIFGPGEATQPQANVVAHLDTEADSLVAVGSPASAEVVIVPGTAP